MESPIRILLVDDDAEYVDVVRHYLRQFQNNTFEVTQVGDGEAALEMLRSNAMIDLILMDYFLPSSNGVEVCKQIADEKFGVPIVLLTSNKDFRIAIEAMKYGVEDYLVKDETKDTMLPRTILNVLERVRLSRQITSAEITQKKIETVQELVVTMCHEFNNPLAAIKISADILSRQKLPEEEQKLLQKMNENIALLEKQIVKLRDLNVGYSIKLNSES